jgi:hypothetical protein
MLNPVFTYTFSIATIVSKWSEYEVMKTSFEKAGFTNDCEYLVADNTRDNVYDAFTAINYFKQAAQGRYLIVVHQDVVCVDTKEQLLVILEKLTAADNNWAVAGNAGYNGYHQPRMHITYGANKVTTTGLPARVQSLDENLLLINNSKLITVAAHIKGFHLYGTDICLRAALQSYTAYVIPFMVHHLSMGNLKDLDSFIPQFLNAYQNYLPGQFMQTTCTRFYIGGGQKKRVLYNRKFFFFFVKLAERLKQSWHLLKGASSYKTHKQPLT